MSNKPDRVLALRDGSSLPFNENLKLRLYADKHAGRVL